MWKSVADTYISHRRNYDDVMKACIIPKDLSMLSQVRRINIINDTISLNISPKNLTFFKF